MSSYLVDTGVLVRHLRGQKRFVQLLRHASSRERLAMSVITRLEICVGMRDQETHATPKLLARFQNYDLDQWIADRAGDLIKISRKAHRQLTVPDAIIAATAVQHNLTLITLNTKDFHQLPGLRLYPIEDS